MRPVCPEEESQSFVKGWASSGRKNTRTLEPSWYGTRVGESGEGPSLLLCLHPLPSPPCHVLSQPFCGSVAPASGSFPRPPPQSYAPWLGDLVTLGLISTPPLLVRAVLSVLSSNLGSFISQSCDLEHIV